MKTFATFKDLDLPAPLHEALEKMKFIAPTPVQAESIPHALKGKDVLGSAQTGTGKTAAFGIPLLAKLYPNPGSRALILAPTRELAAQIHKVLTEMSAGLKLKGALLVGGESFYRQKSDVKEGADFYVCTPGRLIDHLDAGLRLTKVSALVLDEVDRMLDMGFAPQLKQIVPHIPKERQTLFFSATLPKEILAIAASYLKDPVRVSIGATSQPIDRVKQENHATTHLDKNQLLLKHLAQYKGRVLIFARTQHRTDKVFHLLERNKHTVVSLHGGRTQGQRKQALHGFRSGSHLIMVATDIAGRGIDVDDIECVINYDLPANREDYIHRIGRTARNGKTGLALNYLTPNDHEGRGIISVPQPKPTAKPAPAPIAKPNNPGSTKGGWETRGGRNKPQYHKRSESEGYGGPKRFGKNRKPFGAKTPGKKDHFADRRSPSANADHRSHGETKKEPAVKHHRGAPGPSAFEPKTPFGFRPPGDRRPFGAENRIPRKPFNVRRPGGKRPFGPSGPSEGGGPKPFGFAGPSPDPRRSRSYDNHPENGPAKFTGFRAPRGENHPRFDGPGKRGPRPPFGAKRRRPGGGPPKGYFGKPA